MAPSDGGPQRSTEMQVPRTGLHGVDSVNAVGRTGVSGLHGVSSRSEGDQLALSDAAAELQELRDAFERLPDVREDVVRRIKQLVESGQYQIRNEAVAEKLLRLGVLGAE